MLNEVRIAELKDEVGEDDFIDVVRLFCEEVEEVLAVLPSAANDAMIEKLHFLKGSALNIGMTTMAELCHEEEVRLKASQETSPEISRIIAAYLASKSMLIG